MALISVLIPVCNAAATIAGCLHSVLQQHWRDFEVIIVDDGSSDETPAIVKSFAHDPRIRLYCRPHAGIVAALNYGLTQCSGDYIARMDADDLMRAQRLARQLWFAEQHPDIDLIGAQFRLFRTDGLISAAQMRYQRWSNSLLDDAAIKRAMFVEAAIAHPTFFARKTLFDKLDAYRDHAWAEDYDFLLRAHARGARFGKVPCVLIDKRDSASRLYRTDPRCKRPALLRAKAHYFARGEWLKTRQLFIAGSGSSGRGAAIALRREGIAVAGFIDNKNAPGERCVQGLPAFNRQNAAAEMLLKNPGYYFFLLCIDNSAGREEQEAQFRRYGLEAGKNYLRFF